MQLGTEMAEIERGVPVAAARIGEERRDRLAEERHIGLLPFAADALETEQALARRDEQILRHIDQPPLVIRLTMPA